MLEPNNFMKCPPDRRNHLLTDLRGHFFFAYSGFLGSFR